MIKQCWKQEADELNLHSVKRDKLYLVKVVDKNSEIGLVKIHCVGYSNAYDEWRNKAEVESNEASVEVSYELVKPFSLCGSCAIGSSALLTVGGKILQVFR